MGVLYTRSGEPFLVDEADIDMCSAFTWCRARSGRSAYITTNIRRGSSPPVRGRGQTLLLHRFLTGAPRGMVVDHINGDGTDCRRNNMRVCTQRQNTRNRTRLCKNNTTGVTGVYLKKDSGLWWATIRVGDNNLYLGSFATRAGAAQARRDAESHYYGAFAPRLEKESA